MKASPTKRSLSPARQRLVELMQEVNFGKIEDLRVVAGEPVLSPAPRVLRDYLIGGANGPRNERRMTDFALKQAVQELFDLLEREGSVTVKNLVVQNGLPVRFTVAGEAS